MIILDYPDVSERNIQLIYKITKRRKIFKCKDCNFHSKNNTEEAVDGIASS